MDDSVHTLRLQPLQLEFQVLGTNASLNDEDRRVDEHPGRVDIDGSLLDPNVKTKLSKNYLEYWLHRSAAATPTNFPLRHVSSAIADSSVLRTISVARQSVDNDYAVTLPTLVTLAYALVLGAHSGSRNEVVFGYVLRELERCADLDVPGKVGAYITTVPFDLAFDWDRTTLDVLLDLQDELVEIQDRGSAALRGASFSGSASDFRTILDLLPSNDGRDIPDGIGHDLFFLVTNNDNEAIQVDARFSSSSISNAEVEIFLDHLGNALDSILKELSNRLSEVSLMGSDEKQRSVGGMTSPATLSSSVNSITELIEAQARETPQKIALQFLQDQFVTYHQMDSLANDLAHKLIAHGVRRGDLVGIYIDKSIEMFLSILATHKAGGAYVPLDPENPPERTRTTLVLAESKIVLMSDDLQGRLNDAVVGAGIASLVVDVRGLSPSCKLDVGFVGRDDVCHVLFTSGSTGTPKGVLLSHGAVVESILGSRQVFGARNDRVLQFSNYTFDFSVWDWGATLSAGGTLCIAPKRRLLDDLGGVMNDFDVTFLETTPTVVSLIKPRDVPSLAILTVSGERMTLNVRDTWVGEVQLFNTYGPTETSTCVLANKGITSQTDPDDLGYPFGVNSVYVLDDLHRPVPSGCVGELYISGPQVALGYLKNPEQTTKSFTADPFQPGSVMYASGDLVRMSPVDGSITYLGRRDTQIKIRGLRVELGEIEEVLKASDAAVINAVVVKVDIGREALIAFIECHASATSCDMDIAIVRDDSVGSLSVRLRQAVCEKLPTYMAPAAYVFLNRFPLTTSGKLNRNALHAYFVSHEEEIREFELGGSDASDLGYVRETELHALIRSLWASVLRLRPGSFGIDDDFYTMGGDSISAIRLASAARAAGIRLVATDVIEHPTIRAMARVSRLATIDRDFDDDDVPCVTLEEMVPDDLTLMGLDQGRLEALRCDLLQHKLSPSDVLDVFPCTAMQSSFLLAGLSVDAAYIVRQAYDLQPGIDAIRLREAFDEFVDHPNGAGLRTVFVFDTLGDRFLQVVMRPGWKRMQWTTVVVTDETDLGAAISEWQDGCGSRRFEDGELLTRVCVFEVEGVPLALAWSLHHGLADHWTMDGMEIDIGDLFAARPLRLRRSFKPMIRYLEGVDRTVGLEFWRAHLLDAEPTPFLQAIPGAPRAIVDMSVSREVYAGHGVLTERFGIMPSSLVTAAWSVVLAAHSATADVVFGQVVAGRNAPIKDIDTMTGHFINTVARRVVLNPEDSVLDMLRRIQSEQIEIGKHDHIALGDLMSQGIPVPSLIRTLLNFTNLPVNQARLAGEQETTSHGLLRNRRSGGLDGQDAPFTLTVTPLSNEVLCLEVSFIREAISQVDVDVILDHLESALRFLTTRVNDQVGNVDLISDAEKGRLVADASRGKALSSSQNISELIEEQVRRTPKKVALQFNQDAFITYEEMDSLSNDLASRLAVNGVKPGALVALCMDKSIEMFLAILATHKAGGGYVPVDPEYPDERIRTVVGFAQVKLLLSTCGRHERIVSILSGTGVACMLVDLNQLSPAAKPDVKPACRDDVCHVLFTSGSTGTPKGVVLTHGSIIESVIASREVIGTLDGRVLQFSNYTFDFSVWDWGATLTAGGTLCIAPKERLMNDLGGISFDLDVTFLETTPSVVALVTPEQIPSLQVLVVGGESLTPEVRNTWADAVTLINAYGPTEASTNVIALRGVTTATACSNIGYPFGLNTVYVLDERRRLVPLGCVGELFIRGPQLAVGYLNDPGQSAQVFVDNPFCPGTTIYATGDLVRMNAVDCSLTFLGRRDTQIKIHGLRVEVEEIEEVLKAASEVVSNAVVIKVDIGRECLIAFLECPSTKQSQDQDIAIIPSASLASLFALLRQVVRKKLPVYMAPANYIAVNRFPLTTSGKLDRKALTHFFMAHQQQIREMEGEPGANIDLHTAPQTEIQALVRSLWASVLKVDEGSLGIDDDFYTSGGDSLSAIRISSAARAAGLHLLVSDVVRNASIRAMATIAAQPMDIHDFDPDVDVTDAPGIMLEHMVPTDLPLLRLDQEGLDSLRNDLLPKHGLSVNDILDVYPSTSLQTSILMAGLQVDDAYIVQHVYDLPHDTDVMRLQQAFGNFINHPNGSMLRTVFVFEPSSNRFLQVVIRPGAKQMERIIISVADDSELEAALEEYKRGRGPRSFADGELMTRLCVFELNGFARALVWTVHHVLEDGWTQEGFISDIQEVYAHRPPPLRRSFQHMIKYLENLDRSAGLEFWKNELSTAVPTSFLQPLPGSPRAMVNATLTRRIQTPYSSLSRGLGIIASSLATAAWALVLAAHTGSLDVVFGHVLAGRSAPIRGIDTMTGLCINTVARRVVLNPQASIVETLRGIQADQINITKHEYITFHDIESQGVSIAGLFRSLFNFRNLPEERRRSVDGEDRLLRARAGEIDAVDLPWSLTVSAPAPDRFTLDVSYRCEVVSTAEVEVILDHYEAALNFMARHPHAKVQDIDFINPHEKKRLLRGSIPFNMLNALLSPAQNVSELIEAQVRRTPHRIALQFCQDVFLTYQQMDTLSNDLAHKLVTKGVQRKTLVALYMDKSIEMFLSILATHKAGGGYVPLDPEYPAERIRAIIGLAQVTVVVTTRGLHEQLVSVLSGTGVARMLVDFQQLFPAAKPDVGSVSRSDISHVLFTSGSTGIPKGVILTHGAVIESIVASREVIGVQDGRVLQFANYTFDISVWDWGCTWTSGGTLCVVPKQRLIDDLGCVAEEMDVTFMFMTPTVATLITPEQTPSLQTLVLGGEALTPKLCNTWADAVTLVNVYGPTETSTCVVALRGVTPSTPTSSIGHPFGLNTICILDERLQLVPLGCVGELFIGGPQLAVGYLNDPHQTAKVFVDNPFCPGTTIYATGDLVRMNAIDCSLTFLGRRDTQIKIHGLRVEVGEIEEVLKAASEVVTNAVVIKVDIGRECLVAFLECPSTEESQDQDISIIPNALLGSLFALLRHAVRQKLPIYMAPANYIAINRFPLTTSGKLDRKVFVPFFMLHQQTIQDMETIDLPDTPRTEIQELITSLWSSVLHLKGITLGIDDDFFTSGGDSLSAIRLSSAARAVGLQLLATDIIRNPTIRAMAQIAESAVPHHDFDDDDIPSIQLDQMSLQDLTLLTLDKYTFAALRDELLPKHGISASDVLDIYPTATLQTSFLMAGLLIQDAYIVCQSWNLPSETDSTRLRRAFEDFIDHPNGTMFRTVFVFEPSSSRWLQVLLRPRAKRIKWETMVVTDEAQLELRVSEYKLERSCAPFEDGELFTRVCVVELDGFARVLLWSLHHALTDHWTLNSVLSDIECVFAHRSLSPRRSFKPMIKYLEQLDRKPGLDFWRNHLHGVTPTPFLQSLPSAPRVLADATATRNVQVGHGSFTRQFGITASTLVTSAWSIVLAAHSHCADVVFGQVLAGRSIPIRDIDSMMGITINTVARRVILDENASVIDTMRRIQSEQIEMSKHEHITLADLQSDGIPVSSYFKSLLNFINLPGEEVQPMQRLNSRHLFGDLRPGGRDGVDLPLVVVVVPRSTNGFALSVHYSQSAVSEVDVNVVLDHFEAALLSLTENPLSTVSSITLINEQERQRLVTPSYPRSPIDQERNILELIEGQARRTPQKIALQFDDDIFLSYREMDGLANSLASKLMTIGVQKGKLAGICMDKSIEMFISILAILKAGAGYVPLDPEYPPERIRTIIGIAGTTIVLTSAEIRTQFDGVILGRHWLVIDVRSLSPASKPDTAPIMHGDVCHILFTSGSTGTPKGVVLTHGSVTESVLASRDLLGVQDGRVLQFANYTFDITVWDWGCTWTSGGTLCVVPKKRLIDDLGGVAGRLDVTSVFVTPTVATLVTPEQIPSLQTLILGGEALTPKLCSTWADAVTLVNVYGPTETSTCVVALRGVTPSTLCSNIGHPFGLNTVYILDEHLRLVPLGCVGELFIGGPQLAVGYLSDPDQSAKVFVDNPFCPGTTMYATGDLARMNAIDGSLTFLGRRDTQIKIHGLRVEVGEIEEVLKAASEVVSNAVVVKVDIGRECLIAFLEYPSTEESQNQNIAIIPSSSGGSLLALLRQVVHQKLPAYMAPSHYVVVNRFPLTTSGKLDRKALAQIFLTHQQDMEGEPDAIDVHTVPQTEIQALVRSLWASVLKVDESSLGIDDDFYMSGGDSLSAIRISGAARAAGLNLLVSDVVRNPSIRAMARVAIQPTDVNDLSLDASDPPDIMLGHMCHTDLPLLKLDQAGFDSLCNDLLPKHGLSVSDVLDVYPSTSLQTSMLMAGLQVNDAYMINHAYDLPRDTDVIRLKQAFEAFIDHPNGVMLRTVFVYEPSLNQFLQVVIRPGTKQMEWITVSVADDSELEAAIEDYKQAQRFRSFADGEMMTRACVFQLNGFARTLVWTVHHVLRDGWTLHGQLADIHSIYVHRPLTIRRSFKQLISYLDNLDRTAGLEFWESKLSTAVPTPFLQRPPGSPPVLANASYSRRIPTFCVPLAREFGIMASTLATAAWALVLAMHTSRLDVVFGQVLAGRSAPITDAELLVGLCINTVARRVILDAGASILDTLRHIQADQIDITKHEYITFHDIQSRGIPVAGLFSTLFSFQNLPGQLYVNSEDRLLRPRTGDIDTVELPWSLTVTPSSPDDFILNVSYHREAISAVEVEVILDHYEAALGFMARHPHAKIQDIDFINPDEKKRLLRGLMPSNTLNTLLSPAQNVSELIEAQVRRTPHRIALQFCQDVFLTYQQMDSLSNDLAHKLITKGVQRKTSVALYMDKSIEMFLSILATHKAGGGYVPLDPEYPAERIRAIIDTAQVTVVMTTRELHEQIASVLSGTGISCLLVDFNQLSSAPKPNVKPAGRRDVCHILFTSGSTGIPKGVILTHGSIIESLVASREIFGTLDGRVLQFSNYTFDITVWDWGATLTAGGTLCIAPKQQLMDSLGEVAANMDATFLFTTPTVAALMAPEQAPYLQKLALGGEALKPDVRNTWAKAVTLIHGYGPTEASTCVVALKDVTPSTPCSNIGYPFGLNAAYVLDEHRRLVPLGCAGELFIGGPQLAQGYLQDAQQTDKVFVDNPFCPGTTIYATGDLVRMNPVDCSLTFLGRRDTQIKIHGLRVEVGEIEAILKAVSDIPSNVVVVKVDVGRECLVTFLECPSHEEMGDMVMMQNDSLGQLILSLKYAARQKLPSYMVPAYYVALNRLPLTSSGKMDRKALIQYFHSHEKSILDFGDRVLQQDVVDPQTRPQTELQLTIRSLWSSVLGITGTSIGLDDDFFAVGGDSISAVYIANAARAAGLQLLATDIIRNPTLRAMADIAESIVIQHEPGDDDDIPSVMLDHMSPQDLTLLVLDQDALISLRDELLPNHGISASDVLDIYPTTTLQTSFLMTGLLVQDAYIISQVWDLPIGTDSKRLRRAFEDFIDHPNGAMFRTVFVFEPSSSRWLQVLLRPGAKRMKWETVVVTDEAQLDLCIAGCEERRTLNVFDDGELLTHAYVLELNGFARVLMWSLHHALTDHWTIEGILSDIETIFARRPLTPRRSFKPMIKYLERLDRSIGLEFWRYHLQGAIPTPFLQPLPGAPRVTTNMTVQREVQIDHSSLSRQFGITASTTVTCAWAVVLAAHSNCADVVFGQVLAGRSVPIKDVNSMTGITINTVARRVILDENATVIETLRQVQSDQIDISKHEHIALTDLQSQGIPVSDLFNTLLNFRNFRGPSAQNFSAENRLFLNHRSARESVDFPFALTVDASSSDGLAFVVNFASETISEAEVETILDHFEAALLFFTLHPYEAMTRVKLVNSREAQRLLPATKSNSIPCSEHSLLDMIEAQASHTPLKIALQFTQEVYMTYKQMDSLANGLAHNLLAIGIDRGDLIGLYMDKSLETFISILATHKAGAAYVPLDPDNPPHRIRTILGLSRSKIVLTSKDLQSQFQNAVLGADVAYLVVDVHELSPSSKPDVEPIDRDDICHVLFTSGSTGTPKGVVLSHGAVLQSVLGSREVIGTRNDRVLQFSNYTFDFSVWDWGVTLSTGGTLCIAPKCQLFNNLAGVLHDFDITFLETTPTVISLISPEEVPSLAMLVSGGERMTAKVRSTWAEEVHLVNVYGPTEATVCVVAKSRLTANTELDDLGHPFGANSIYVLDRHRRLVPLGCVGELCISGPQVALGYLNSPEQTANAFIDNPFQPGSVMYTTGDLVRMSPIDSSIIYLGRLDAQIKIRGLRVEPGEIEEVLKASNAAVVNAVVVKVELGNEALIAFIECHSSGQTPDITIVRDDSVAPLLASLRQAVRQKLPTYMAPTTFVFLNRFPVTTSGKLDRNELRPFFLSHEKEIRDFERRLEGIATAQKKRTRAETRIMRLWQQVLEIKEDIDIDDTFVSVGGDSVGLMRLGALAHKRGILLSVTDQLRNPTIRGQAKFVPGK